MKVKRFEADDQPGGYELDRLSEDLKGATHVETRYADPIGGLYKIIVIAFYPDDVEGDLAK